MSRFTYELSRRWGIASDRYLGGVRARKQQHLGITRYLDRYGTANKEYDDVVQRVSHG